MFYWWIKLYSSFKSSLLQTAYKVSDLHVRKYRQQKAVLVTVVCHFCDQCASLSKGKGHPRTGHEGPEEEKMYGSTLSLTSVLHRGRWLTPRPGRFTPRNDPVPTVQEARWAPGPGLNECGKSLHCPARSESLYY